MDWLNYHHLYYFWTVAREGSIAKASEVLRLAPPTISAQIKSLESSLDARLLTRRGRGLTLTDTGRVAYDYADDIFSLGREMVQAVRQGSGQRARRFQVGVVDSVPKLLAREILKPVLHMDPPSHLVVREGKLEALVGELALHHLDMVLADHPYNAPASIKIYHHRLGETGVTFFASAAVARKLRGNFPQSLDGAPALLHAENTAMRRTLENWFEGQGIRPQVVAEFEDSALLKVFGGDSPCFFAMPSIAVEEVKRAHRVAVIGSTQDCREQFYAISAERRLTHPAVLRIRENVRDQTLS